MKQQALESLRDLLGPGGLLAGDDIHGNLHLAVARPPGVDAARSRVEAAVHDPVRRQGGSVSAEHGTGVSRRAHLGHTGSEAEIATMRALERTLDPNWILNPGRVFARQAAPARP